MPRVRRQNIPRQLLTHLLDRVEQRNVSVHHLALLIDWLETEPEVPNGKWFKEFSGMTVCGEGELVKTFLQSGQIALGEELD
ncbi:MAG: hypothetical protein M3Y82_12905 [Verrucomicrobiota bacterium]|nr:hypothetical protein [Verrucomicrobiota bacterium]